MESNITFQLKIITMPWAFNKIENTDWVLVNHPFNLILITSFVKSISACSISYLCTHPTFSNLSLFNFD